MWRRFFLMATGGAACVVVFVYLFVVTIDPWNALPLSPPLPRVPVTTSVRYALPMLARDPHFDSAVIGTSTVMQLRPDRLDAVFGGHFVNLAIVSATSHEEVRMLRVFLDAHPNPRLVIIGMDVRWCDPRPQPQYTFNEFPEWLYDRSRWSGYLRMYNLFAVQEAGRELGALLGFKRARHGLEDAKIFYDADKRYVPAIAHQKIAADGVAAGPGDPLAPPAAFVYTTLGRLERALAGIPGTTRKILVFVPFALSFQGPAGSPTRAYWAECKRRVSLLASKVGNTTVVDFMLPSTITSDEANYFDALHYRPRIADQIVVDLARASQGLASQDGHYRLLAP